MVRLRKIIQEGFPVRLLNVLGHYMSPRMLAPGETVMYLPARESSSRPNTLSRLLGKSYASSLSRHVLLNSRATYHAFYPPRRCDTLSSHRTLCHPGRDTQQGWGCPRALGTPCTAPHPGHASLVIMATMTR
jgi:hypothetical protein